MNHWYRFGTDAAGHRMPQPNLRVLGIFAWTGVSEVEPPQRRFGQVSQLKTRFGALMCFWLTPSAEVKASRLSMALTPVKCIMQSRGVYPCVKLFSAVD